MNQNNDIIQCFKQTSQQLGILIECIPQLADALHIENADSLQHDIKLLKQIPSVFSLIDDTPAMVVALAGPSGAGKSTVFNSLTGLSVPSGGAIRPMTYASAAAIPERIIDRLDLSDLFPGFELQNLTSATDLKDSKAPVNRLFYTSYPQTHHQNLLWLCLVDMPDFNTTEIQNWHKAEQMINRADTVIFTVYHESYKDQKTFEILKRCCRLSGNMIYLLTKLEPENAHDNAKAIQGDIISCAAKDDDFQQLRADGKTLLEYLIAAAFFFSPYKSQIGIEDIKPVQPDNENFNSTLFGQKGLEIILNRQFEAIYTSIISCEKICDMANDSRDALEQRILAFDQQLKESANQITGTESPVFHVLAMLKKLLEENRPPVMQTILKPFSYVASTVKSLAGGIKSTFSRKEIESKIAIDTHQRDKLERGRLAEEAELLVNNWRRRGASENLDHQSCREAISSLVSQELPPVDEEWEVFVRQNLQKWFEDNKGRWLFMNTVNDLLLVVGTSLVVVDVFVDGGVGTLGVVAAIGSSSATGGFILSIFNNMGLKNEILQAHDKWKELRQASYFNHLSEKLAGPLFLNEITNDLKLLDDDKIVKARNACKILRELIKKNATS